MKQSKCCNNGNHERNQNLLNLDNLGLWKSITVVKFGVNKGGCVANQNRLHKESELFTKKQKQNY